jgi:hypothetical protein
LAFAYARVIYTQKQNTKNMKKCLITLSTLLFIAFPSIAQQKKNNTSQKNSKPKTEKNSKEEVKGDVAEVSEGEDGNKVEVLVNGNKKNLKLTGDLYGDTELRGVINDSKLGFINSKNKLVTPLVFDVISYSWSNGICILQKNGKKGVVDEYGNEILTFIFENIVSLNETYNTLNPGMGFTSGFTAQLNGKWGIYDPFGNSIIPHIYDEMTQIEYKTGFLFSVSKDGKTGLIDKSGNILIPLIHNNSTISLINRFNDDKFQVSENGLQKIVDIKKNRTFQKDYYNLKYVTKNSPSGKSMFTASISDTGNLGMIDEDENILIPFEYEEIKSVNDERQGASSCFVIKKNGRSGVFNIALNMLILEPKYDNLEHILDEYYKVNIDNKWGISKYKEDVLSPEYDEITYVKENIVKIRKESVISNFDFNRRKIASKEEKNQIWKGNYQSVEVYGATYWKYFVAKKHTGEYGLIDSDENIIIPFELGCSPNIGVGEKDNNAYPIDFIVERNGKYGLFSKKNKALLTEIKYSSLKYIYILDGKDGIYIGSLNDKKSLLKNGKEILPLQYDGIEYTGNTKVSLLKENKFGIWDFKSKTFLLDLKYSYIFNMSILPNYYVYTISGKTGLILEDSTNLLPCEYDRIYDYNTFTNCLSVNKSGKVGLFHTKTNKLIIPAEFENINSLKNHFIKVSKDNKWAIKHLQYPNINTPFVYQDITMLGDNLFLLDGKKYRFIKDKMIEIPK